ncbi:hypothetical protein ACFL6X_05505 [Candidatus Latescibacterota bacterium]
MRGPHLAALATVVWAMVAAAAHGSADQALPPAGIRERVDVFAYLVWLWALIAAIICILGLKIGELRRLRSWGVDPLRDVPDPPTGPESE